MPKKRARINENQAEFQKQKSHEGGEEECN